MVSLDHPARIFTVTGRSAPFTVASITSWNRSDYVQDRQEAAHEISAALGVGYRKTLRYIDDINGIAKMIADDKQRLDYVSALGESSFVSNVEYGGSKKSTTFVVLSADQRKPNRNMGKK